MNWLLIRGTGVAAFTFLAISTIWGLLLSTKVLKRWTRPKTLTNFHESLGAGALLLTVVHLIAVRRDEFIGFSWNEVLLPGLSGWRPYGITVGVLAFYGLVVVTLSFYAKRRLGIGAWRVLHSLSLGVFVGALLHGVLTGTDTGSAPMVTLYSGSAIAVAVLLWIRLRRVNEPTAAGRAPHEEAARVQVERPQKSLEAWIQAPSSVIRMTRRS